MRLTSTKVGVVLNVVGVKLFRGIVVGGIVPIGATVTSGLTTLITVPGVGHDNFNIAPVACEYLFGKQ